MHQLARLSYLRPSPRHDIEKPYYTFPGILKTLPEANYEQLLGPEQLIEDVRECEEEFSLQKQGFTYRSLPAVDINWDAQKDIAASYLPQVKQCLAQELNLGESLKRCEVFDWRVSNFRLPDPFTTNSTASPSLTLD